MSFRIFSACIVGSLLLASCTNPFAKKDDFQTVVTSHTTALINSIGDGSYKDFSGTSHFEGNVSTKSPHQGMTFALSGDGKMHAGDYSNTLSLSGSINSGTESMGARATFETLFASGAGYMKVDDLGLNAKEAGALIEGLVETAMKSYKGKWVSLSETGSNSMPVQKNPELIKQAVAKHPVLSMQQDLGFSDGSYHYTVGLDRVQMLELEKEIRFALTGTGNTEVEDAANKQELEHINLSGTLSVEDDNRAYGAFSGMLTYTGTGEITHEPLHVSYSNSSDNFQFNIGSAHEKIALDCKKELTKVIGKVSYTNPTDKVTSFDFTIERTLEGYSLQVSGDFDAVEDHFHLMADGKMTTKKDDSIRISPPTDSIGIESLVEGIMGLGAASAIPDDSEESGASMMREEEAE